MSSLERRANSSAAPPSALSAADGSAIGRFLEECRRGLERVQPSELERVVSEGALLVDIRPACQRDRDGELPGAVIVDRNVLEWRLDPSSPHRLSVAVDPDRRIVLVCNQGYSSSLAARTLQLLGLRNATDLCGGYQALLVSRRSVMTTQSALPVEAQGPQSRAGRSAAHLRLH